MVKNYISPEGFSMIRQNGRANPRRIFGGRKDGQLLAHEFYLEASDGQGDLKLISENNQLKDS